MISLVDHRLIQRCPPLGTERAGNISLEQSLLPLLVTLGIAGDPSRPSSRPPRRIIRWVLNNHIDPPVGQGAAKRNQPPRSQSRARQRAYIMAIELAYVRVS